MSTRNGIEWSKAREAARHNKEEEFLKDADRNARVAGDFMKSISGIAGAAVKGVNDVAWYIPSGMEDLAQAANISFGRPAGMRYAEQQSPAATQYFGTSPLFILSYIPSIGKVEGVPLKQQPVMVAARTAFDKQRKGQFGTDNYESTDLVLVDFAAADIIRRLFEAIRAIGLVRHTNLMNRNERERLIEALGFQAADVFSNVANYTLEINTLIHSFNQLHIPGFWTYVSRAVLLSTAIFRDAPNLKSPLFAFRASFRFHYDEANSACKAEANTYATGSQTPITLGVFLSYIQTDLGYLLGSQSVGIITGDALNAFGESAMVQLQPIAFDYVTEPIYDDLMADQIRHATLPGKKDNNWNNWTPVGAAAGLASPDLRTFTDAVYTDNEPVLVQGPLNAGHDDWLFGFQVPYNGMTTHEVVNPLLSFDHEHVQPAEIIEATRLTAAFRRFTYTSADVNPSFYFYNESTQTWDSSGVPTANATVALALAFGTEIISSITVYYSAATTGSGVTEWTKLIAYTTTTYNVYSEYLLAGVEHLPYPMYAYSAGSLGMLYISCMPGDNVSSMPFNTLCALHRMAILAEFGAAYSTPAKKDSADQPFKRSNRQKKNWRNKQKKPGDQPGKEA